MRISTLPGVFRPRPDTWLLARVLTDHLRRGDAVLDVCTGSGALAVTAALHGAGRVVAVDVSRRAVLTARLNARRNGVRVDTRRGDLFGAVEGERFDLVVSNPPYVPARDADLPRHGERRAWDAGIDGRAVLDPLCARLADHLQPGGTALLVHSELCGVDMTLERLRSAALEAGVVERHRGELGPIVRARRPMLVERGLLAPDAEDEEVVVIRAVA